MSEQSPMPSEFAWNIDAGLPAGTVLTLKHENNDVAYEFVSYDTKGHKQAKGYLFVSREDEVIEHHEAVIDILHPVVFLAQENTPFVQFTFNKDEQVIKLTPAFTSAEFYLDQEIASDAQLKALEEQLQAPFNSQQSQSVITALIKYLKFRAQSGDSTDYQPAADVLEQSFNDQ